jgi:exoribonuclease R
LERIKDRPDFLLIQTMLLRSLSQAVYSPDNIGHFGLAYPAYAHFTSPILRTILDALQQLLIITRFRLTSSRKEQPQFSQKTVEIFEHVVAIIKSGRL